MEFIKLVHLLSRQRPIFHNEADFQHALAWAIHEEYPSSKIRLEVRPQGALGRIYLDILVDMDGQKTAIELKYKTRQLDAEMDEESFSLLTHGAHDCGRYDVIKDIQRLEQVVDSINIHEGYTLFLTNDNGYWTNQEEARETADKQFRLPEGRVLTGDLAWGPTASSGTTKGRVEPIRLQGEYLVKWLPYSNLNKSFGEFRFMVMHIQGMQQRFVNTPEYIEPPLKIDRSAATEPSEMDSFITVFSKKRPVFRSQQDLRDAVADYLQQNGFKVEINRNTGTEKIDIWAIEPESGQAYAFEFRYKTAIVSVESDEETFSLKHQGAQDISRYDYWSDVAKLESVVSKYPNVKGVALFITNDHLYWDPPKRGKGSVDECFLTHHGRHVTGKLHWDVRAGLGTTKGREEVLHLSNSYHLYWRDYSSFATPKISHSTGQKKAIRN